MSAPIIVWIGEAKSEWLSLTQKRYTVHVSRSGKQGRILALQHQARLIVLDAHSLGTSGERICHDLRQALPNALILHVHPLPKIASKSEADAVIYPPLKPRTFMTHLNRLLKSPVKTLIRCGEFSLDTQARILYARSQEIDLNPKQCQLLALFFNHPNQVLERSRIMREVWNTDYIEDTSTLNVHMRLIRDALEGKDSKKPRYLVTVRGVGYRLEIDA